MNLSNIETKVRKTIFFSTITSIKIIFKINTGRQYRELDDLERNHIFIASHSLNIHQVLQKAYSALYSISYHKENIASVDSLQLLDVHLSTSHSHSSLD